MAVDTVILGILAGGTGPAVEISCRTPNALRQMNWIFNWLRLNKNCIAPLDDGAKNIYRSLSHVRVKFVDEPQ